MTCPSKATIQVYNGNDTFYTLLATHNVCSCCTGAAHKFKTLSAALPAVKLIGPDYLDLCDNLCDTSRQGSSIARWASPVTVTVITWSSRPACGACWAATVICTVHWTAAVMPRLKTHVAEMVMTHRAASSNSGGSDVMACMTLEMSYGCPASGAGL